MILAAAIILTIYLLLIGKQPSISESVYTSKWGFLFYPVLIAVTTLLMIESSNIWMFIAGGCIWFTAGAAKFKEDITKQFHYIGAVLGYLIAMAWVAVTIGYILPAVWLLFTIIALSLNIKSKIYWIEVVGFYIILISLWIC